MTAFERLDLLRERRAYVNERKESAFERFEAHHPDWFMVESGYYTDEDYQKYFRWYKVGLMINNRIYQALDELLKQATI